MPGLHHQPLEGDENPEVQLDLGEEKIFKEEDIQRFPSGRHVWRQQGPYVVCRECDLHHGTWIGMKKEMVGEDENGRPILRDKTSI